MRIGIVINNVTTVEPGWTTTHLAHEALVAGHTVRFIEARDFEITPRGRLVARASIAEPPSPGREELANALMTRSLERRFVEIGSCDLLLLRVNPLTDATLNLALMAQDLGVPVLNDPSGIARTRAKSWLASLPEVPLPPTLVTSSRASAELFARNLGGSIVIKPVLSSGGRGVTLLGPDQLGKIDEAMATAQGNGNGQVVLQGYLEAAEEGEKRLVWIDGRLIGGYLRTRSAGEFRHNLRCGGEPQPYTITTSDRDIAAMLTPHLRRNGIRIAGLDVIGERLVEVNTLNPGGVHFAHVFASNGEGSPEYTDVAATVLRLLLQSILPSQEGVSDEP